MPLSCNIDTRGQRVRRVMGVFALLLGIVLGFCALYAEVWWLWIPAFCAVAGGVFSLYEARKKWCALRAMGVKTPL